MEEIKDYQEEAVKNCKNNAAPAQIAERPLKLFIDDLPSDKVKRKRALNNIASRKSKRAKKEFLARQEKELEELTIRNKQLHLEITRLEEAISQLKLLFLKYGVNEVWRPWSGNRSFIKDKKYSIGMILQISSIY